MSRTGGCATRRVEQLQVRIVAPQAPRTIGALIARFDMALLAATPTQSI
ncbi:MAG TPA: hypothetical protein VK642_04135 [Burkholderiales bacterium]|nr:hypothetical protein [Burkholderiales bacterium]